MTKLRHITSGLGLVSAPLLYLAGRATSITGLYRMALAADPQYLRALHGAGHRGHSRLHVGQFQTAALFASEVSPALAEQIKHMLSISEAQLLQDVFCATTLNEKERGFFVEVGVGSGQLISNTYMLEKYYGWSGLLVEPNRSSHASIENCRTAKLERRAAASESGRRLRFQEFIGAGEHSRIAGTGGHYIAGAEIDEYDVETVSLTELLTETGAPLEIDYLSLDTEGSEIDILRGLDLNRFRFNVMTIEHNYDRATQNQLGKILAPHGYRQVLPHISMVDAWYVHASVQSPGLRWLHPDN